MALPRNLSILAQGANATGVLGASKGGTNLTAFVTNGALYATSTTALASGTLPVASGGTGITSFGTGVATALGQAVTGTGGMVLSTNATITTPSLAGETFSTTATVTAGTNAQGSGALTSDYNVITTAANNPSGVTLPTATTGRRVVIVNKGANPINIYPATGAAIDALANNASIQLQVDGLVILNASSTTRWYSTFNLVTSATSGTVNPTGGGTDKAFNVNSLTVTTNYTIPAGYSAMSTGPITVNANVTVTVPSGSKWVVL